MRPDVNSYRWERNKPISAVDPSGLWSIDRAKGATAVATSQKGDTIGSLASKIGLYVLEYAKWLTTPNTIKYDGGSIGQAEFTSDAKKWGNTKLCPGQKFEIPNRIMCLWYGDVGERGKQLAFSPYVEEFKRLGFDVDVFDDRDANTVLGTIQTRTKDKMLQGLFVVGHGKPGGFGTGGGWFDYNSQQVSIDYADIAKKLEYKLGVVILWVCFGGGAGGRSISSQSGESVFNGVDRILIPFYDYPSIADLFPNGKQGTKSP